MGHKVCKQSIHTGNQIFLVSFKWCLPPHREIDEDVPRWGKSCSMETDDNAGTRGAWTPPSIAQRKCRALEAKQNWVSLQRLNLNIFRGLQKTYFNLWLCITADTQEYKHLWSSYIMCRKKRSKKGDRFWSGVRRERSSLWLSLTAPASSSNGCGNKMQTEKDILSKRLS